MLDRLAAITARFKAQLVIALLLTSPLSASANAPLQERASFDDDIRLGGASLACGFEVRGHFEGSFHFTVFYDREGNIVREVDTFPSLKFTIYAPSTGKSYSSVGPAMLHTWYTDGASIGSPAVASLTGLLERFGNGDMDGGRFVFNAIVVGYDAAGVPLIRFVSEISSVGPDRDGTLAATRCASVR